MNKQAFSLVELSIVLVILGLLTGGILAGQSLIRASELRAVSAEYSRYKAATYSFRDKYFALPGDMTNAQSFWGQSTACSGASATGTCNGNGDGNIGKAAAASATGENYQFWNQLALAGLIEGQYTGIAGSAGFGDSRIGINTPASKVNSAGWDVINGNYVTPANAPTLQYGNAFTFGTSNQGGYYNEYPSIIKPEEAWNIDTKLDDGKPMTGQVVVRSYGAYGLSGNCTTAASATDTTGVYNFSNTSKVCSLYFPNSF